MKENKLKKWILVFAFLGGLGLFSTGCGNTGLRFLEDVNNTLCCFSPALALPLFFLTLRFIG